MERSLTVRRARRGDFGRVRALLGLTAPAARAEAKRFRRLVSALREDLYLAERADEDALAGLAVIAYTRGLGPPTALVRRLRATSTDAASVLLECARARAAARGCATMELRLDSDTTAQPRDLADTLRGAGWVDGPPALQREVKT